MIKKGIFALLVTGVMNTNMAWSEATSHQDTLSGPSCVKVCQATKSGKMRRSCNSSCSRDTKKCETSGGHFLYDEGNYRCFSDIEVSGLIKSRNKHDARNAM